MAFIYNLRSEKYSEGSAEYYYILHPYYNN